MNVTIRSTDSIPEIVIWKIKPTWTMDDYNHAVDRTRRLIQRQSPKVVDVLVDMTDTLTVPTGAIGALVRCHFKGALMENYGIAIIVSQKPIVQVIFPMLAKAPSTYNRIFLAKTIDEARAILAQKRRSRL